MDQRVGKVILRRIIDGIRNNAYIVEVILESLSTMSINMLSLACGELSLLHVNLITSNHEVRYYL